MEANSLAKPQFNNYMIDYEYEGSKWSFEIPATSFEDAEARLQRAAMFGHVEGQVVMTMPAIGKGTWLPELVCRIRNWWTRRA